MRLDRGYIYEANKDSINKLKKRGQIVDLYKRKKQRIRRKLLLIVNYQDQIVTYVDKIIIFSYKLENYLKYLCQIFSFLAQKSIFIKFTKVCIRYRSVYLLGQKVDLHHFEITKENYKLNLNLNFSAC